MKTVKKNVYYCDFCKKRGLSAGAMAKHEKHCTMNPDRECRLCSSGSIKEIISDFKKRFILDPYEQTDNITGDVYNKTLMPKWTGEPVTLEEVINSVDGCPNCVLSILRQCEFNRHYFVDFMDFGKYDYKTRFNEEMKSREAHYQEYY